MQFPSFLDSFDCFYFKSIVEFLQKGFPVSVETGLWFSACGFESFVVAYQIYCKSELIHKTNIETFRLRKYQRKKKSLCLYTFAFG